MAVTAVKWLYLTAFVLVAYWLHTGYRSLVAKGKQAQFRLEQRRRAGIPDSDKRPYDIAQADAAQARRRKTLASRSQQNLHSIASASPWSSSPFGHSISTRNRIAAARSPAASPLPLPGQSNRYDPHTYRNRPQQGQTSQQRPYNNFTSPDASSASSLTRQHQSRLADSHSPQDDENQPHLPTREQIQAALAATAAATASRGKKRGPSEARDVDEEDSIMARRYNDRKRYHRDLPDYDSDDTTPDEEMDNETERGTAAKSIPSSNQRGAKRALDQVSMSRVSEDDETADGHSDASDDEEEQEEVEVPRQRGSRAKIASRPTKRVAIRGRGGRKNRSLQDEMHDLSDADERDTDHDRMDEDADGMLTYATDDEDMDDSMRSIRSRRKRPASLTGSRRSIASAVSLSMRDVSDSERDVGEEWTDPKTGLQWRMDEDDVMSEEETSKGTKRRVMVKRRVKRRLTVRREMKSKWGMPADSLHPDAVEMVPHYVPAWLSEAEFEDAKAKGQLGFQAGENNDKAQSSNGSPTPRSPSARNLDALFHQASSSLPLRSSPLSRSATPLRQQSVSHRTSSPSLNSPAANRRSRLSLAGTSFTSNTSSTGSGSGPNSGTSSPSGMKPRLLDSAAKRRREEELMRKLKESKEKQQREQEQQQRKQQQQQASVAAQDAASKASSAPAGPALSFGAPEKKEETQSKPASSGSTFSFGALEKKEETQSKPSPAGPAFSFGAPEKKEEKQSNPPPAGSTAQSSPFNLSSAPQPQPQPQPQPPSQAASASSSPAPFLFGASKPAEPSQPSTVTPAASIFSFGAPKKEESAKPASSSPVSFSAPPAANAGTDNKDQKTASTTPFTFGGAPQTNSPSAPTPFTFGAGGGAGGGGGFTFNLGRK